jgi:peptidoglycan hydrolase-like protein with peptidoglycan-binding domain
MIELGSCDPGVSDAACAAYEKEVEQITRLPLNQVQAGADKIVTQRLAAAGPDLMSVSDVQRGLKTIGFFPGAVVDGICGYRTLSAIRLFQEYVRTVEKIDCVPDGRFGPRSQQHLQRWLDKSLRPDWAARPEYTDWLALLEQVKAQYLARPNRMLQMVNAHGASDTRPVAQWDFSATGSPHLIGVRRTEFSGKFDDVFVLLLKGLVFKFQGSTEPGASDNPRGAPFLVQGQHDYHFGWHKKTYLALRPQGKGVLVVRSKNDKRLDEADLAGGLEAEPSINVHWGGMGMARDVNSWSEGCQVINGAVYINSNDDLIDCSAFCAVSPSQATDRGTGRTRGAYNVLVDLVTALASDVPGNAVRYTLLAEQDLDLSPGLKLGLAQARDRVIRAAA